MADSPTPDQLAALMPFVWLVGIDITAATPDEVVATLDWSEERCTAGGVMHGGALMTLADTAGAVCAFLGLPEGATTTTLSSSTNLFRAVTSGTVTATARPLHRGRRTVVVQTDVADDAGKRVAQVTQTQAVLT